MDLLALVDKSLWNFPSVGGLLSACLMDDHMPLDDYFARYNHSCLFGLDDHHGRIGVGSIFSSPSGLMNPIFNCLVTSSLIFRSHSILIHLNFYLMGTM